MTIDSVNLARLLTPLSHSPPQVLALLTMEAPVSLHPDDVR